MKDAIILTNENHTAIRVALMQSIREYYRLRRFPGVTKSVKEAVAALRVIRNSSKLESTPFSFVK
jgi:hypothetical protein